MGVSLNEIYSHPGKLLSNHTDGVYEMVCELTTFPVARAAALFHDFGKVNPNFQRKLFGERRVGYSHHAYLSAYLWLVTLQQNKNLLQKLNLKSSADIYAVTMLIAKHHGDLPDLERGIFELSEADRLRKFLENSPALSLTNLESILDRFGNISIALPEAQVSNQVIHSLTGLRADNPEPLRYFLETRYAFASLINADKREAAGYSFNPDSVALFCQSYNKNLSEFLNNLNQESELNKLRAEMRIQAIRKLNKLMSSSRRTFALTAPTGSGKTLMLLSLAGEIIKAKGAYRIIYVLPFLSITEQVFSICKDIFGDNVTRIDSRAENTSFEMLQKQLDEEPDAFHRLLHTQFAEDTFEFPFIITTFVRFFETLLSNRNAALLKLPNFSRAIFLIDEIQALPPRLYTFFVALLQSFCRIFESYAIISTATMPDFRLPANDQTLPQFFTEYEIPPELLPTNYFKNIQFNRYILHPHLKTVSIEELVEELAKETLSALIILNTIDDTKKLHKHLTQKLSVENVVLLNSHFTPNDRLRKLEVARRGLRCGIKVILISTQLVEAGVDIDFPVVYRDLASFSSIVQSAGRCNRNNLLSMKGKLVLIELEHEGKKRWRLIHSGPDAKLVNQVKDLYSTRDLPECELFEIQRKYFESINSDLLFGYHKSRVFVPNGEIYFVERIRQAAFTEIGKFQLIDELEFGKELRYYVPHSDEDNAFENLRALVDELKSIPSNDHYQRRVQKLKIDAQLHSMAGQVVQIRIKRSEAPPVPEGDECCGMLKLSRDKYDYNSGIKLDSSNQII